MKDHLEDLEEGRRARKGCPEGTLEPTQEYAVSPEVCRENLQVQKQKEGEAKVLQKLIQVLTVPFGGEEEWGKGRTSYVSLDITLTLSKDMTVVERKRSKHLQELPEGAEGLMRALWNN